MHLLGTPDDLRPISEPAVEEENCLPKKSSSPRISGTENAAGQTAKWEQLSVLESLRMGADHLIGTTLVALGSRAITRLMISLTSYRTWAQTVMGRHTLSAQKHRPSSPCCNSHSSYSGQSRQASPKSCSNWDLHTGFSRNANSF